MAINELNAFKFDLILAFPLINHIDWQHFLVQSGPVQKNFVKKSPYIAGNKFERSSHTWFLIGSV